MERLGIEDTAMAGCSSRYPHHGKQKHGGYRKKSMLHELFDVFD